MAYWEFLLQKEGDRSWLPLESPNVEILEGRYRVVARTNRANTTVEIRVTHVATEEMPPRRRVQKRSHHTNQDGLMVVFPFTRLRPGIWEISCVGDVMADLLGQGWEYSVQLQVLSQQQAEGDDWEPDWQAPDASEAGAVAAATSVTTAPIPDNPFQTAASDEEEVAAVPATTEPVAEEQPELPTVAEPEPTPMAGLPSPELPAPATTPDLDTPSADPALPLEPAEPVLPGVSLPAGATLQDLATTLLEDAWGAADELDEPALLTPELATSGVATVPEAMGNAAFQLALDQVNLIAAWGQVVTLVGQIDVLGTDLGTQPWQSELQVCLRDPQTLQVLSNRCQSVAVAAPTTPFSCEIEIPAHCQTRLLLGEISLYSLGAANEASLTPLTLQTFTITAALDELLGVLPTLGDPSLDDSSQTSEPNRDLYAVPLGEATEGTDLSNLSLVFLDLLKAPKQSSPLQFQPSESQPLPPQIYRPNLAQPPSRAPQLPSFSRPDAPPPPEAPAADAPILPTDAAAPPEAAPTEAEALPTGLDLASQPALPAPVAESPVLESDLAETAEKPETDEGLTFQSLRLQERFWSRLNAIATDAELSAWLKSDGQPFPEDAEPDPIAPITESSAEPGLLFNGIEQPPEPGLLEPDFPMNLPVEPEDVWLAREIVVDDDLEEVALPTPTPTPIEETSDAEAEDVPMPELEVPEGELIAGKRVLIRVKLSPVPSLTHVKLWINDRQTRSLMDGPRWITDFIPNSAGLLETSTQVTVPFGSLEVQFEAIAVVVRNQRESRKVSISRAVVPPDLPTLSLDELDA